MRVALVAEEAAGVHALRLLAERGEDVVAVLTTPPPEKGTTVATVAAELGLSRLEPELMRDPAFAGWIAEQGIDLLLNVHSLVIADGAVLAAPRIGSFNLHPAPLPAYAGLSSPSWAIAEGESRHAVTLHWMTAEVDAGAIPALPQSSDGGSWYGREVPHDGRLPWQLGARRVVDLVRAADYAPFPSPWGTFATRVGGEELEIVRVARTGEPSDVPAGTIGSAREGGVPVSAGDEWVLVERVRRSGAPADPADALPAGERCDLPG